jgi:hypothetical protein
VHEKRVCCRATLQLTKHQIGDQTEELSWFFLRRTFRASVKGIDKLDRFRSEAPMIADRSRPRAITRGRSSFGGPTGLDWKFRGECTATVSIALVKLVVIGTDVLFEISGNLLV